MIKLLKDRPLALFSTTLFMAISWALCPVFAHPKSPGPGSGSGTTYNVKNYGAVGNGINDDSHAIAAAIAAGNSSPGSTVLFPAGNYLIGSQNPQLKPQGTTLMGSSNATLIFQDSSSQIVVLGNNTGVKSLSLTQNGSSQSEAIAINGAQNYTISGNIFTNWKYGVNANNVASGSVTSNTFSIGYSSGVGVYLQSVGSATVSNNSILQNGVSNTYGIYTTDARVALQITGNKFTSLNYGVYANVGANAGKTATVLVSSNTFQNCTSGLTCDYMAALTCDSNTFSSGATAIYSYLNSKETITGNSIDSFTFDGIQTIVSGGEENTISANKITNVQPPANGIFIEGASADNPTTITGNTISSQQSPNGASGTGIYVTEINKVDIETNTITNFKYGIYSTGCNRLKEATNTISNIALSGIYSYNDAHGMVFTGNKLSNCGLISGAYAVIYANANDGPNSFDMEVSNNSYTASSDTHLSYYIYLTSFNGLGYGIGFFNVFGNKQTTMLPIYFLPFDGG